MWGANILQDTVMLGADYYETEFEVASILSEGRVPIGIGENTKIKYFYFVRISVIVASDESIDSI